MTEIDQLPNNGNQYCPFGSQPQIGSVCPSIIDLLSVAALVAIFPEGVPTLIEDLIAGVTVGTIASAALCQVTPKVVGPWPFDSINPVNIVATKGAIIEWLMAQAYLYAWNQCCQCKPPSEPDFQQIASGVFPPGATGRNTYIASPAENSGWDIKLVGIMSGNVLGGGQQASLNMHVCDTPSDGNCQDSTGSSCTLITYLRWEEPPGSFGLAFGTPQTVVVSITAASPPQQGCWRLEYTTNNVGTNGTVSWWIFAFPTGPITVTAPYAPPTLPNTGPSELPPGFPNLGPQTAGGGQCNFAPASAVNIETLLVPQGTDAIAEVTLTGSGELTIPPGSAGFSVSNTVHPVSISSDGGTVPYTYQGGTVSWGIGLPSQRVYLGYLDAVYWGIKPSDTRLVYNIPDGWTWVLQWLGATAPT